MVGMQLAFFLTHKHIDRMFSGITIVRRIISLPRYQSSSSVSFALRYLFNNGSLGFGVIVIGRLLSECWPAAVTIHRMGEIFDAGFE